MNRTATWGPEAQISITRNDDWRPNFIVDGFAGDMKLRARGVGAVLKNDVQIGPGTITAGIDFARDNYRVDNYGDTDFPIHELQTRQIGAFVQGRFAFENGIDLSTGMRLGHHRFIDWNDVDKTDSGASANVTISYQVAPGHEVFAAASRTWRGHDLGEYGYLHARDSSLVASAHFEPATARNYKLGLCTTQDDRTGKLTFFDTTRTDLANAHDPVLNNGDACRSLGFTLQGSCGCGSGRIGASLTKAKGTVAGEDALATGGNAVPIAETAAIFVDQEIAQHDLTLGATLELASRLSGVHLTDAGLQRSCRLWGGEHPCRFAPGATSGRCGSPGGR